MNKSKNLFTKILFTGMAITLVFISCSLAGDMDALREKTGEGGIVLPDPPGLPPPTIIVVEREGLDTLADKLTWLKTNAVSNSNYLLEVYEDESFEGGLYDKIDANYYLSYNGRSNITIYIKGKDEERVLSLKSQGILFGIGNGVTLILNDNITFKGRNPNWATLVHVKENATLIMNTGAKLIDNKCNDFIAGAVWVEGGTFIMNGGEISGNSGGEAGGAVLLYGDVDQKSSFTMNDGLITNNFSYTRGGGVSIEDSNSSFTMKGGEISNNKAGTESGGEGGGGVNAGGTFSMSGGKIKFNQAHEGGGVSARGNFIMTGGEITDNTAKEDPAGGGSGGGVAVDGKFTMNGGIIARNIAQGNTYGFGGGVYVNPALGTIMKANGGTIFGHYSGAMDPDRNIVKNNSGSEKTGMGNAVYITSTKKKEGTADIMVNLDSTKDGAGGGWFN